MIKILQILEKEIRERENRSKQNYVKYIEMKDEVVKLKEQIEILKNDLRELSEFAKKNNIV
jgi:hypothetical protein